MDTVKLKVRRLSELLSELVDYTSMHNDQITDFSAGSGIRSIYEAIAMTQEQLYQLSTENVTWAIDHAILDAFDFTPREAQRSYGEVTVDLYTPMVKDIVIGRGTTVYSTAEGNKTLFFQTQKPYKIEQGTTSFKIEVTCNEAGEQGNIPAGYIDTIKTTQLSVLKVTNEFAFLTGKAEESASDLKKRFREFVATRGRATKRAVIYGVNTVPEVAGCFIEEKVGEFTIYAHDANGDLPDSVRDKIINAIDNDYRPVSIKWSIKSLNKVKVSLNIEIAVTNRDLVTNDFIKSLRLYIEDYLNHFKADDDLIPRVLAEKIINYSSIITDVNFVGGATYTTAPEEIIRAGTVTVTLADKPNFNGANELPKDESNTNTETPDNTGIIPKPPYSTMLDFKYYNSSYNYNKSIDEKLPVSTTYYDENHVIITTLPYNFKLDITSDRVKTAGNMFTRINEYDIPIESIKYDNQGSVYTTYDEQGKMLTRKAYDNFGGVAEII
jgi:hypothetical protein